MHKVWNPLGSFGNDSDATCAVYMQNYLLRTLLPHYGVHFLPQIAPSRILSDSSPLDPGPKDTLRFPIGTPNAQTMEAIFLKNLIVLLERVI